MFIINSRVCNNYFLKCRPPLFELLLVIRHKSADPAFHVRYICSLVQYIISMKLYLYYLLLQQKKVVCIEGFKSLLRVHMILDSNERFIPRAQGVDIMIYLVG